MLHLFSYTFRGRAYFYFMRTRSVCLSMRACVHVLPLVGLGVCMSVVGGECRISYLYLRTGWWLRLHVNNTTVGLIQSCFIACYGAFFLSTDTWVMPAVQSWTMPHHMTEFTCRLTQYLHWFLSERLFCAFWLGVRAGSNDSVVRVVLFRFGAPATKISREKTSDVGGASREAWYLNAAGAVSYGYTVLRST